MKLWFIEAPVFTKRVDQLGLEEDLRELQVELLANPGAGTTDRGTGGLRKVRMTATNRGKGKRGGTRVHYLWLPQHEVVYLLFVYGKDEQDKLSPMQKKQLKKVVDEIRTEWG